VPSANQNSFKQLQFVPKNADGAIGAVFGAINLYFNVSERIWPARAFL
jgi:hypothetical protein